MSYLTIKQLTVGYQAKNILTDFNLALEKNEIVVILGPSGCGKSTLLKAIAGLITPSFGEIKLEQQVFSSPDYNCPVEKRNIGYCFQSYALWPHLTVKENIAFPLKVRKYRVKEREKRVNHFLALMHLTPYQDYYPNQLSGGQQQRVSLARSLIYEPKLLLLDEPLANLDQKLKQGIIQEIKQIQQLSQTTMIYVTHDQKEAFALADRIVLLDQGKIIQVGTAEELYLQPNSIKTAEFIGENNLLKAKTNPFKKIRLQQDEVLTIRLEDLKLNQGENVAKIIAIEFCFSWYRYTLDYQGVKLYVLGNYPEVKINTWVNFQIIKYQIQKNI